MLQECVFHSENHPTVSLQYYESKPASEEKLPLLVYIHGAGSRGDALSQMSSVGPLGELRKGRDIPAVMVTPQCHADTWFDLFDVLMEFIEKQTRRDDVDANRIYLCGISMGAYASWQAAMSRPDLFAALVAVCGGGMYWNAARLKNLPIWAFHGALDDVVLPEESIHMVRAVNNNGGAAKITIYPDVHHDAWIKAYADDAMWEWLFEQKKG